MTIKGKQTCVSLKIPNNSTKVMKRGLPRASSIAMDSAFIQHTSHVLIATFRASHFWSLSVSISPNIPFLSHIHASSIHDTVTRRMPHPTMQLLTVLCSTVAYSATREVILRRQLNVQRPSLERRAKAAHCHHPSPEVQNIQATG